MKKLPKSTILDTLHKGFVLTCIGVTIISAGICAHRAYVYFTAIKPEKIKEIEAMQKRLLEEGSADKILLKDNATEMKM